MNIKRIRLIVIIWIVVLGLSLSGCGAGLLTDSTPTKAANPHEYSPSHANGDQAGRVFQ